MKHYLGFLPDRLRTLSPRVANLLGRWVSTDSEPKSENKIKAFEVGDRCWMLKRPPKRDRKFCLQGRGRKLDPLWIGPVVIVKKLSGKVYRVKTSDNSRYLVHFNQLKHYKPMSSDIF